MNLATLIVAGCLMGEAGGEPSSGREAVAEVIAVRMQERQADAVSVCLAPHQFCFFNDGVRRALRRARDWDTEDSDVWKECVELAERVIHGVYPINKRTRYNHFYAPAHCRPSWARKLTHRTAIGKHVFGRISR